MTPGSRSRTRLSSDASASCGAPVAHGGGIAARLRGGVLVVSSVACSFFYAIVVCALYPVVIAFDPERHSLHQVGVLWARTVVFLNPWWKFHTNGRENLPPPGKPVVFVANHKSQTDILSIYLLGVRFRWLSKESILRIPIFGWAMRAIGYVGVRRGDKRSHIECMQKSAEHLARGTPMVFFPEGTRSKTGVLTPFKSGAFRLACESGADVIPLTILGTETLLPKGSLLPNVTSVKIIIHPAISSLNKTPDELSEQTRAAIAAALPEEQRSERILP